jgi:hypothetical protein
VTPLDNFPLIRSRNVEEVREAIERVYVKPVMMPVRGTTVLDTTINNCRLPAIDLAYRAFGAPMGLKFPTTEFVALLFPMCGTGEIVTGRTSIGVTAGAGAVVPSDAEHQSNYSVDYAHLVLRVRSRVLSEHLSAMTGATINEPLRMNAQQSSENPVAQMLRRYLPLLLNTLDQATPPFPDWWITQTEQFVITLVLCGHRHNYSHLLEQDMPDAGWRTVRQAEEYIEANAQRAITLEELAQATGVSTLTLFRSFKKYRGYSPTEFLSRLRAGRQ